jgi:hypothetical protein
MTLYIKMATVQEKAICVLRFFKTTSVIKTQHRYRTQYGKDNYIRRWLMQFQENGNVVAAIETVTHQMLENTWREIEYRLDILRARKGAHVYVV